MKYIPLILGIVLATFVNHLEPHTLALDYFIGLLILTAGFMAGEVHASTRS